MKLTWNKTLKSSLALGVTALVGWAAIAASDYPLFRGDQARTGRQSGNLTGDTPGRTLIRWWDPVRTIETQIDNWEAQASFDPADWFQPSGDARAFNAVLENPQPGRAEYRYAYLIDSINTERFWEPVSGTAKRFSWNLPATTGQDYQLFVNIPVGPTDVTDVTAPAGPGLYYPQRYFVYEIVGVENPDNPGQPVYEKIDTYLGGGNVRMGNGGQATDKIYRATAATVVVTLLNTIPKDSQGFPTEDRPNTLVYGDAASIVQAFDESGETTASPVVGELTGDPIPVRVVGTRNSDVSIQVGSDVKALSLGNVTSYQHNGLKVDATEPNTGGDIQRNIVWSWPAQRPFDDTEAERTRFATERQNWLLGTDIGNILRTNQAIVKDNLSTRVSASGGWLTGNTFTGFRGTNYAHTGALVPPTVAATERVFFRPEMQAGDYTVDVWVPDADVNLAQAAVVELYRGAFLIGRANLNQSTGPGWRRLTISGVSEFASDPGAPISVAITNLSTNAGDAGRTIIADSVRFTKTADLRIKSTPVMARIPVRVGATTALRDVAIVAMENGRIYCLDAAGIFSAGSHTGKTQVYWTYPSELPEGSDPNKVVGLDGPGGIAEMPIGFDISSANLSLVDVGGTNEWLLYIGTTNGRVYCIRTEGRGDGTTERRWSWPNDYPSAPVNLNVGPITGSISIADSSSGGGPARRTVFVPTQAGRLYALDAAGDGVTKVTTTTWQYPAAAAPLGIGAITMTPAIDFGKVFFGTGDSRFYALNLDDPEGDGEGNVDWSTDGTGAIVPFSGFGSSSPVLVPGAAFGGAMPNMVYVANSNRALYALRANDGGLMFSTNELPASPSGGLAFSYANVYNNLGNRSYDRTTPPAVFQGRPVVWVPMVSGQFKAYFAFPGDVNKLSTGPVTTGLRDAGGYKLDGSNATSIAFGGKQASVTVPITSPDYDDEYTFLYIADNAGFLYAFGDDAELADGDLITTPGTPPVIEEVAPNDPTNDVLSQISQTGLASLLLPADYEKLQKDLANGVQPTFADIQNYANNAAASKSKVTRAWFDYGETLYLMIWNLPNPAIASPSVNYQIQADLSGNGASRRQFGVVYPLNDSDDNRNRISLVAMQLSANNGSNLAPGTIRLTLGASASRTGRGTASASLRATNVFPATTYGLAHPLGISRFNNLSTGGIADKIGITTDPSNAENQVNGSYVAAVGAPTKRIIRQSFADSLFQVNSGIVPSYVAHGQAARSVMTVVDRSAMTLLLGPGRGLQNVRFRSTDLAWKQTDLNDNSIAGDFRYKTLPAATYPGFEDAPQGEDLNVSLDYPNIRRDSLAVTKDQFQDAQNPQFQAVGLEPPFVNDLTQYKSVEANYNNGVDRSLEPTIFRMDLDVPRFQPPTLNRYESVARVFVDAQNTASTFNLNSPFAYRDFRGRVDIAVDETLNVRTRTVDLGQLPQGALYQPGSQPVANGNLMSDPNFKTGGEYAFPFSVWNEGNVNMLNVRIAKDSQDDASTRYLWSSGNNPFAYLDSAQHLHSDLDPEFTPTSYNRLRIIQKARPDDGEATRLRLIPLPRGNANLGVADSGFVPVNDPKVTVSVPIGTPVGEYRVPIYAFEDAVGVVTSIPTINRTGGAAGAPDAVYESYADPFTLMFKVREARLTNRRTAKGSNMVDDLAIPGNQPLLWSNHEPSAYRDVDGDLIVAYASNRRDAANGPGWIARDRADVDASARNSYGLYLASMSGGRPTGGGISPFRDLENWGAATGSRWFIHGDVIGGTPLETLFGLATGEVAEPGTARFGLPAFPAMGSANPLTPVATRSANRETLLAFVGEVTKRNSLGETTRVSRLFVTSVTRDRSGRVSTGPIFFLSGRGAEALEGAQIGRPSIVQVGDTATIYFTTTSGGAQQLNYASTSIRGALARPVWNLGTLNVAASFETINSVSAVIRPDSQGGSPALTQLFLGGKLRGRSNADVYIANVNSNGDGTPRPAAGSLLRSWENRVDVLSRESSSNFYGIGVELVDTGTQTNGTPTFPIANPATEEIIDVLRLRSGQYESILDHSTKQYSPSSRLLIADTIYGGQAQIDLASGSVRFTGALIPTNVTLYIRSMPRFVRISESNGVNYAGVHAVIDDRFQTELNYAGSDGYQFNGSALFDSGANVMTADRMVVAFNRTSTSASNSTSGRPYLRTLRYGAKLPALPALNTSGFLVNFRVNGLPAGTFYQVDPVRQAVYVSKEMIGRPFQVVYTARLANGTTTNITQGLVAGIIGESGEVAIPIDQPASESPVTMAVDPFHPTFTSPSLGRPGLLWMFWSSTRDGSPDLYFQTWAPRLNSTPPSSN